jgi:hypothetical protein
VAEGLENEDEIKSVPTFRIEGMGTYKILRGENVDRETCSP